MTGARFGNTLTNPRDFTGTLLAKQQRELKSTVNTNPSANGFSIRELFTDDEIIAARNEIIKENLGYE